MEIYIVRHGQTDWNIEKRMQGMNDIPLNENGIKDARLLAEKLANVSFDLCLTSPLQRAKQTAEILTKGKAEIIVDNRLVERGFGSFEGQTADFELIKLMWNLQADTDIGGIEKLSDCLSRANVVLEDIKEKYNSKKVLIVSHGSFIKAMHYNISGYDENTDFLSFSPQNAEYFKYEI